MKNIELKTAIVSFVLIVVGYIIFRFFNIEIGNIVIIIGTIIGAYFKAKEGICETYKNRRLNVEILMIVAAIGAIFLKDFIEAAILIIIFAISGALETLTKERSKRELSKLIGLTPDVANKVNGDEIVVVKIEDLVVGDIIELKPGERVPVDVVLLSNNGEFDVSALTGESKVRDVVLEEVVYSGSVNLSYVTRLRVNKVSKDSMLQKIIKLVKEVEQVKPKSQSLIEKIESIYVLIVIILAILLAIIPPWFGILSQSEAIYKAMVMLVVASPCAIMASVIPASLSCISACAQNKILVKGGNVMENLADVKAICFDKTGTLTDGILKINKINSFTYSDEDFISILASIESKSNHPIAISIMNYAKKESLLLSEVKGFKEISGNGIVAMIGKNEYKVGKQKFVDPSGSIEGIDSQMSYIFVSENDNPIGYISLKDTVRSDALGLVRALKKLKITPIMITGDNHLSASLIAKELEIEEFYADTLPSDKVSIIDEVTNKYQNVAMIGDGINDAPALAKASVSIAMGQGSEIAIDTANIVLMRDELSKVLSTIIISKGLKSIIYMNFIFASVVILMMIFLNLFASVDLPFAVVMHEGSTILVILNGIRLLRPMKKIY